MLQVTLFGATQVLTDGATTAASDMGGVKPRQILGILAASAGVPVPKDRLADLLWGGAPPKSYVGTLESYVCVLRRRLGLEPGRSGALATTSNGYVLDPALARVDLVEFRTLVKNAVGAEPAVALRLTQDAVSLVSGELLASEAYTDWASVERELFRQELVAACTKAAEHALAINDLDAAVQMARMAVTHDRIAEAAWQHLMRALWLSGRGSEALRAYSELRAATADELGIEPGPASRALYMEILQDGPAGRGAHQQDHTELRTLLGLLRQALEAIPGVELPPVDGPLAEIAVRLLRAA
jgi:DNA-binding SARP family transcriptional activator